MSARKGRIGGGGGLHLGRARAHPPPAVVRLRERYGGRASIVYGNLPDWLVEFASTLSAEPCAWIESHHRPGATSPASPSPTSALEHGAQAWAAKLAPSVCAMALAFVATACSEPQSAMCFVEGILRKLDGRDGFTQMKSLCANALGNLLADLGRYEEALARLGRAVELAQECGDADSHDRWLGNLACCLETLCRIDEARSACESALEGHRSRGDPAMIAYAPTSLASHLIRQMRLDQAKAHAEEAIGFSTTRKTLPTAPCAKRRRRDGDETRHLLRAPARALKDDPASVD